MKHFSDDGCNKQPDYDYNIFHHYEDEKIDYDKPIGVHFEPTPDDWYEGTIKHFQD